MIVLGLDLSLHTGWSAFEMQKGWEMPLLRKAGLIDCSIQPSIMRRLQNPEGQRFHLLRSEIADLVRRYRTVTCIFYEAAVGGPTAGGAAARIALGMSAIVQELCSERLLHCESVAPGTLKKHATGHGGPRIKKPHMIAAAIEHFGCEHLPKINPTKTRPWIYDDNVADALWIGHYGACQRYQILYTGSETDPRLAFK